MIDYTRTYVIFSMILAFICIYMGVLIETTWKKAVVTFVGIAFVLYGIFMVINI